MMQTINISLIPSENKPVINVSQFDNISRVLRFNVFDDVEMTVPHVFDNTDTVLLNIRKNDNNIVVITGEIITETDPETQEVTGYYLTFELTEQACACVGSNFGEVSITRGSDEVIGSCNFKLIVERSPLAGGVSSQTAIDNLTTQIEQITEEVIGDNYYDKQEIDDKFDNLDIPTKTSDLENDSGFITSDNIPTKTSQLQNDSGYITEDDIPTIPTKTSQLQNDSGYITEDDIPTIPTKTSQLQNDSGFTTIDDTATANDKTWSSDKISDELYALLPVGTVSSEVASFNTALAKPLVSCVVDENATKLYQRGINLFDKVTKVINGYYITDSSGETVASLTSKCTDYIPIKGGLEYRIVTEQTVGGWGAWYDENKQFISGISGYADPRYNVKTAPANACFCRLTLVWNNNGNPDTFGINYPITNQDYHNYNGVDNDLPLQSMPVAYVGDNNFFADIDAVSLSYKDTIQNYIDTRVNTVSNRSQTMQRTLETLETIEPIERGDNNDDNAR